jgi:hypothetical protein
MTKSTYLDQIEFKIAAHQQTIDALLGEIQKLKNAAEVIAQLRGNDGGGPVTLDVTPEKKTSGPITIRRLGGPVKRDVVKFGKKQGQELRQRILDCLTDSEPMTTNEIRAQLDLTDESHNKPIWNTLYYMSKVLKVLDHVEGRRYRKATNAG